MFYHKEHEGSQGTQRVLVELDVGLHPTPLLKREDDGREGAISGRLTRKASGAGPSGFTRTGVFAGGNTPLRGFNGGLSHIFCIWRRKCLYDAGPVGRIVGVFDSTDVPHEHLRRSGSPHNGYV